MTVMAQIKDDTQYKALLERIDQIFAQTDENTPANDIRLVELGVLSELVEEYESEHFPIRIPSLAEMLALRISESGATQKEIADLLGMTAPRLSAILNGKANPTFEQAKIISSKLDIDPSIVLSPA
jgi:HTH-type transcriptional regulator/antitoxin HigA